jgi:hypothetical protein
MLLVLALLRLLHQLVLLAARTTSKTLGEMEKEADFFTKDQLMMVLLMPTLAMILAPRLLLVLAQLSTTRNAAKRMMLPTILSMLVITKTTMPLVLKMVISMIGVLPRHPRRPREGIPSAVLALLL